MGTLPVIVKVRRTGKVMGRGSGWIFDTFYFIIIKERIVESNTFHNFRDINVKFLS